MATKYTTAVILKCFFAKGAQTKTALEALVLDRQCCTSSRGFIHNKQMAHRLDFCFLLGVWREDVAKILSVCSSRASGDYALDFARHQPKQQQKQQPLCTQPKNALKFSGSSWTEKKKEALQIASGYEYGCAARVPMRHSIDTKRSSYYRGIITNY